MHALAFRNKFAPGVKAAITGDILGDLLGDIGRQICGVKGDDIALFAIETQGLRNSFQIIGAIGPGIDGSGLLSARAARYRP